MIAALQARELDVAIGLTDAFVRGLAAQPADPPAYKIAATYVSTPLNWAVSTAATRDDLTSVSQLEGGKIGVSRIGSGSYVMSYVLARDQGFTRNPPFEEWPVCDTFAGLRAAVNNGKCDAFMWEYFTTRAHYAPGGELKLLGNIYTPWASWVVAQAVPGCTDETMERFLAAVRGGIAHFEANPEEVVRYVSNELPYSERDAREWLGTVKFEVGDARDAVESADHVLRASGVVVAADGRRTPGV